MKIKALLFDMDGLLMDSEAQSIPSWIQAGKEMGYPVTEALVHAITGTNYVTGGRIMRDALGDIDYDALYTRAHTLMVQRMKDLNYPTRPFAAEACQRLMKAGYAMAVATSTDHEEATRRLVGGHLDGYFSVIVFGDQVEHGKPAPDIFLLAAEKLGFSPEECAVLEDSPNGILSGKAAGMTALWIPDQIRPSERPDILEKADVMLPDLNAAADWIMEH